jgi:spermidine/putrescine transport system ATP-binding protein
VSHGGEIELRALRKVFDDATAVDGIDLRVRGGEFFSLLGPSGCGKTTTLRLVAGFEQPTSGSVLLDGADVSQVPAHRRNVNTVFQSYALFPHLDVIDNVVYGLRWKKLSKRDARRRAEEALDLVQLSTLAKRRPAQLSGGQQQRVALARALVLRPAVLLLDEPLGALDAKIRKQLRGELKALQEEVGITFLFVTHDQEEALSMSDRIGVMNDGRIDQVGSPQEVYEAPETVYVADFLGVANLMSVEAFGPSGDGCDLRVGDFRLRASAGDLDVRGDAMVVVRPERVELRPHSADVPPNCLPGMVDRTVYVGSSLQVQVRLATGAIVEASMANTGGVAPHSHGDPVLVHLPDDALRLLAAADGAAPASAEPEEEPA